MAGQPPDPATLQTWDDAFAYPLPTVRKLESQLRTTIASNAQKLRSHVGTSYRSLLSTAERIIEMDEQIRVAEGHMAEIGKRCNAQSVERVGENWVQMKKRREEKGRWEGMANLRVAQGAVEFVGRSVRRRRRDGGDILQAAKVLILGRLVLKSLEGREGKYVGLVEELKKRLGGVRRKLLGSISRILVKPDVDKAGIVKALSAYSLVASSSPKEVLRYFLQVRFAQLQSKAEEPSEANLLEVLDLYGRTLIDTREVFPRPLGESLSRLSELALTQNRDVRLVHELSLDVYEQWFAEDVRNFHPWVRNDQLSSSDVQGALSSWSKQAQSCVLQALKDTLGGYSDARAVVQLRQTVISKYLSLSAKLGNDSYGQALGDLRAAFLIRLEAMAGDAATVSVSIPEIQAPNGDSETSGAWGLATANLDLADGATEYRASILQVQHGRGDLTDGPVRALDSWISRLHDFSAALAIMRATKWIDDLDLDLDDLTDDEPLQVVFSKNDPQRLEDKLHQFTLSSLQKIYASVEKMPESNFSPVLLIRILREVDQRRRGLGPIAEGIDSIKASDTFVADLHVRLATQAAQKSIERYTKSVQKPEHLAIALWDGTPPMPTQPAPATFRFLKSLHTDMSQLGTDLWSPGAVHTLKAHLAERLDEKMLIDTIDQSFDRSLGSSLSNGHANDDPSDGQQGEAAGEQDSIADGTNHRLLQRLFDIRYLQYVFTNGGASESQLVKAAEKLQGRMQIDSTARERLEKSAGDYWKRTYLLFGLFADRQAS